MAGAEGSLYTGNLNLAMSTVEILTPDSFALLWIAFLTKLTTCGPTRGLLGLPMMIAIDLVAAMVLLSEYLVCYLVIFVSRLRKAGSDFK